MCCNSIMVSALDSYNYDFESGACFIYKITDSEISIVQYACSPEGVNGDVIPDEIDGFPITTIGYRSFHLIEMLESITLPETLVTIEPEAFAGCTMLTSIIIPRSVKEIGDCALGYDFIAEEVRVGCEYSNFTIYGYTGTAAEEYAIENGFTFIALDDSEVTTTVPIATDITTTETTLVTTNETTTIDTTTESTTLETTATTTTSTNTLTEGIDTTGTSEAETTTTTSTDNVTEVTSTTYASETETTTATVATNYKNITEEDFINWAINDYQSKTGITPANAVLSETSDGYYDITLTDANGNVLDVYTIDPNTAIGTNRNGEEVNLPQTGYSNRYHTSVALATYMTVIGGAMVIGSAILKKKRR